ncbi:TolB family protein [Ornithinimicrobium sufpigmenti]|uniref:TolB family protein n=1 Tax=Ornithinimicrobium sufpigmenti TaxID=2508882 RepID=UPI001035C26D|nr:MULTISPECIES: hypothetical protein [unclassified Ornithinimicrobium]
MARHVLVPGLVSAALLLCGCTDGGGQGAETATATRGRTDAATGAGTGTDAGTATRPRTKTQEVAHSGCLVGQAVIGIHQVDLPDGSAEELLDQADFQAGHTATLQRGQAGEPLLHTAWLPLGPEPLTVRGYRLDGSGDGLPVDEYSWPGTELANRVRALAASPDGTHFAALIADGPSVYLEVVDRRTDEVVFSGRDRTDRTLGLVGDDLLWSQEHGLVYVADLGAAPADAAGGVVGVALEGLQEDTGQVTMSLLLGFDEETWRGGRPQHLALSADETQLAYAYVPEGTNSHPDITAQVWAGDLDGTSEPRQVTSGTLSLVGPAFSPDGQHVAVVEYASRGSRNVYVVDAQNSTPTEFRGRLDTEAVVVATDTRVDTLLGWLP